MQRYLLLIITFIFCFSLPLPCQAYQSKLVGIRAHPFLEKEVVIFEFDHPLTYRLIDDGTKLFLELASVEAHENHKKFIISDPIVDEVRIHQKEENLIIVLPLNYRVPYEVSALEDPYRIVVHLFRYYRDEVSQCIAEGIEYSKIKQTLGKGPSVVHVLRVDPQKADVFPALTKKKNIIEYETGHVEEDIYSELHFYRDPVSSIAADHGAVAAVNGTYFSAGGRPLGLLVVEKEVVSFPIYDRTALILTEDGEIFMDQLGLEAKVTLPNGAAYEINGMNIFRPENKVVLYAPRWGKYTNTNDAGVDFALNKGQRVVAIVNENVKIPEDGWVLSVHGDVSRIFYDSLKVGNKAKISLKVIPETKKIRHVISGGPRLVKEGKIYVSAKEERLPPNIAQGRAARTAVGIAKDGDLLFVTVDGLRRRKVSKGEMLQFGWTVYDKDEAYNFSLLRSQGMTLKELAQFMIDLGAQEAMNLDGGSSSTMVVKGEVVNLPVNLREIAVSNAILVKRKSKPFWFLF